jgi:[protein-PII] uridylyltransferase
MPRGVALLAVGGYGRGTLFPHSDVDVLMLLPDDLDDAMRERVSEMVSRLWDIGLEIGHSARTIEECLAEAALDITVQTNLLEARWVVGDRPLFERFEQAIRGALDPRRFFEAKVLEQQQRHNRFNDTAYNLEPNVKDGPGGLRDLTNILWISGANGLGSGWASLSAHGIVTREEAARIGQHERLLQELRIRLHYQARRREDRLLFDLQTPLALQFGYADTPAKRASEQLMQRYYRTARAVTQLNEIILQNLRALAFPHVHGEPQPSSLSPRRSSRSSRSCSGTPS